MARFVAAPAMVALLLAPVGAQNGNTAWTSWARANHHPIATIEQVDGDTFADQYDGVLFIDSVKAPSHLQFQNSHSQRRSA